MLLPKKFEQGLRQLERKKAAAHRCFFVYSNQRVASQEAFTELSPDRRAVLIEAAAGDQNLSADTLTSTVWVKQNGKWLAQLHTSIKVAQG
jgi:hypothetical protein